MSALDSRNEFNVKIHLQLESNPLIREMILINKWNSFLRTRTFQSTKESWIMFHCLREIIFSLHFWIARMMWILIHQPISWAFRIKIHIRRLCLTNIYTFLSCPFYSKSRASSHARHFPYRETVSTIVPKTHSLNQYRIIFHSFFFFISMSIAHSSLQC